MSLLTKIANAASNGVLLIEWKRTNDLLERLVVAAERLAPVPKPEEEIGVVIDEVNKTDPEVDESAGLYEHVPIPGVVDLFGPSLEQLSRAIHEHGRADAKQGEDQPRY